MYTVEEFIEKCTNEMLEIVIFDEESYDYVHTGDIKDVPMSLVGDLIVKEFEFTHGKLEIVV